MLGGSVVYGGSAQGAVDPGIYIITVSGLLSGNYDITYHPGTLTINAKTVIQPVTLRLAYEVERYEGQTWCQPPRATAGGEGIQLGAGGRNCGKMQASGIALRGGGTRGEGGVLTVPASPRPLPVPRLPFGQEPFSDTQIDWPWITGTVSEAAPL